MDIYKQFKLPDPNKSAYYAEFWAAAEEDLMNLKKYLYANYVDVSNPNPERLAGFKEGIAALYAHFEACLRFKEDSDSPKEPKKP